MGDLTIIFLLFKDKIIFKSLSIKSHHRVLRQNKVDAFGAEILPLNIVPLVAA
jgi:hypothetical protein